MKKRSRNKTRSVLSLIMSLALVLGMCTTSYAAEEVSDGWTEEAVAEASAEDDLTEETLTEDTFTEEPEKDLTEDIAEDNAEETEEYPADEISGDEEYDIEVLSAEELEDEEGEEDSEIQLFEATEENQTLKVVQKAEGTIGDDVSFTYHLYKITEAAETIENMGDIISYEPGAYLDYVIVDTETREEISDGTTDEYGAFAIHVGETAEFTLEAETDWFVTQETPEAYPLISVGSDGEYAYVVDNNGVVYYGNIEPEPEPAAPVISNVSVTSSLENNEKTYDGGSVILNAEATVTPDTATVSYQWYKDGEEISGATDSTYTLFGDVSDSGTYKCVVTAENDGLSATAEAEITVTINKAAQDISYAVTEMDKTFGDEPFTNVLTQTTISKDEGASITYTSSNESVAVVDPENGEVTILASGEVTITATAVATENYTEATASYTITVIEQPVINEVTITSNLTDNEKTYDGENVTLTAYADYVPETASVTYQWYVVDEEGNETEISGATDSTLLLDGNVSDSGTYKCVVTVTNDGLSAFAEAEITITINKAAQEISYAGTSVEKLVGDDSFTNELTETIVSSEEGAGITYASTDESVAIVDPETGEVTILASGETTITASAAATENYEEATASYTLTVREQPVINGLTITSNLTDNEKTYDGGEVILTSNTDYIPDTATITYQWYAVDEEDNETEITGATDSTLTLDGNVVDSGIYKCVVIVTNDGLTTSEEAEITITINKADQDISYDETEVEKEYGDDAFTNPLTEGIVDGEITYSSSDKSVATVDPETGEVTIVGIGEATIMAAAAETDNYNGTSAGYTVTVSDAGLSVNVSSDLEDNTKVYDEDSVTLTAEAASDVDGAEFAYQWYDADDNEIEGETGATLTLPGNVADSGKYTCIVTVTYPNGETGTASGDIEVTIEKAQQSISYTETAVDKYDYDDPFINELTETLVYGDITYSFTTQMGDEPVIELDEENGEVSIKNIGVVVVTATVSGSDDYEGTSASYILTVNSDLIGTEIDVNNEEVDYDDGKGEYVDDLVYDGSDLELEIVLDLTTDELEHLTLNAITYQWYSYDFESSTLSLIDGATEDTYTLTGEDVNAGDYVYLCVADVIYDNGYEHTVYSVIEIKIAKADQSIVFEEESLKAAAGDIFTNEITEKSVIVGDVTYASDDESVATVDEETGEVTIVGVGTVTITATAAETDNYNEASASYTITTTDEVSVTITSDMEDDDNTKTYDGETVTLTAEVSYKAENGTYTYQWYMVDESGTETEIDDATEAELTLDGNAADSGTYKCTVTVTYPNDADPATASATIEITIKKAPQDISYEKTEIEKTDLDDPFTNELTENTVSEEEGAGITYESSDETVATVDENGLVTILSDGEVTITATAVETANYAEAKASYTIVVTEGYNVKYAVSIYGINQDVDADGNILGLTFGPATGASYISTYEAHLTEEQYDAGEGICLHWMSWEEIIEQSLENPEAFEACFENGCTHSVNIKLNETLLATDYSGQMDSGDGTGNLYNSINSNYRIWNSSQSNSGGWPASRDRATLNGTDSSTDPSVAGSDTLSESDSLFSCFPTVLQDAIVAKAVKSDTVYNSQTEDNNVTTYDKLWLFSGKELYGDSGSNNSVIRTYEGELYQRSEALGITTSNYSGLRNYNEAGNSSYWWLRSPSISGGSYIYVVNSSGSWFNDYPYIANVGLTPGFCLAGPEVEQPVINGLTITTTGLTSDNTKTYDGDEVTLTAVADYTPDTATITYQWYKKNDAGEYTEIEGADEDILTLDGNVSDTGTYKCEVTVTNDGFTTSDYAEITITIKEPTVVNYAVKLWGICTDTYSYDEGSTLQTASLTFGPATGADYLNSYVYCDSDTCIHKLSWDEIISLCEQNQGNESALQSLFGSCLENGCTKAVELTPNDTLFNMTTVNNALEQGYTGDGVSTLYYLLNGTGSTSYTYAADWNQSYTGNSESDLANIYSRSRIRATLTGDGTDATEWVEASHNDYYGVDTLCNESNCLLSCFPANLQTAVVPRTTLNTGNATLGTSANDKTTYDKLFLFSLKEIGISTSYDDGGGSDYGVNPNASDRVAYEFNSSSETTSSSHMWWSRSRYPSTYHSAYYINTFGSHSYAYVSSVRGVSPGFCIK